MLQHVGSILIFVFLGTGGTPSQGYIPGMKATIYITVEIIIPEVSNITQGQNNYSDLKTGKLKCTRNENTQSSTTQIYKRENNIPDLKCPWGGEGFATLWEQKIIARLRRGLPEGFWLQCREWVWAQCSVNCGVNRGVKHGVGRKCSDGIIMTCAVSPGAAIDDIFSFSCFSRALAPGPAGVHSFVVSLSP